MSNQKNPCYKCQEREAGCHSKCEKYQSWKLERDSLTGKNQGLDAYFDMKYSFQSRFRRYDSGSSYRKKAK